MFKCPASDTHYDLGAVEGLMIMFIGQQIYSRKNGFMDIFYVFPLGVVAVCPPRWINTEDEEEEFKVSGSLCLP